MRRYVDGHDRQCNPTHRYVYRAIQHIALRRGESCIRLKGMGDGQAEASVKQWRRATPGACPSIGVVPDAMEAPGKMARVSVRVGSAGGQLPEQVWLFPLGQVLPADAIALGAPDRPAWARAAREAPTLDGHVLLRWKGDSLLISSFSQGGGPATTSPFPANPITAGSADGKALLFFYDETRTAAYAADPGAYVSHTPQVDYGGVKVVTTTLAVIVPRKCKIFARACSL